MTSLAATAPGLENTPLMQFYPSQTLLNDPTNKWAPNMACLKRMLEEAQFEIVTDSIYSARGYCVAKALSSQGYYKHLDYSRQPPDQSSQIKFDQPLVGSGWHPLTTLAEHGAACWTGPETRSTLTIPLALDGELLIRFRILMALAPDILDSLKLSVNEQPVELRYQTDPTSAKIFEGRLPAALFKLGSSVARLAFEVNRTLAPNQVDPQNPDERQLGVLFNWIEISPVVEADPIPAPQEKSLIGSSFAWLRRLAPRISGSPQRRR